MSCGSAKVLADLMDKRHPAIASDDLGLCRYEAKHSACNAKAPVGRQLAG